MPAVSCQLVGPYRSLAEEYDDALGSDFFHRVRRAFERLQREYGFSFPSAADIGCGTGLFARYLARRWHVPVFAVDRSPEMLAQAWRTCRGERVRILRQDLRQLRLPCRVGLITANFDVLNHLLDGTDLRQTLRIIRDNLLPGGHFYFDLITPRLTLPPSRWTGWLRPTRHGFVSQLLHWDPRRQMLRIQVVNRRFDRARAQVEPHLERVYPPGDFGRWLSAAGFVVRGMHDEATLQPAGTCPARIIFIAQRPPAREAH
jgi:SAM-dependent methyltransferase